MTYCATNADCLSDLYINGSTSLRNWCVESVACDPHYLACTVWPRCRSWPWLGCISSVQRCVHRREEHLATDGANTTIVTHTATLQTPVVIVSLVLGALIFFVAVVAYVILARKQCVPSKKRKGVKEPRVPLVSIDARVDGVQSPPAFPQQEHEDNMNARLTQLYNERSVVY